MSGKDIQAVRLSDVANRFAAAELHIHALNQPTLDRQLQIARVGAPTGSEHTRALLVASELQALGYRTNSDSAGNVIATNASAAPCGAALPPVVCMAHLDTVFGEDVVLSPVYEGSRFYCPGIGDNGRGLTALLTLAHVMRDSLTPTSAARVSSSDLLPQNARTSHSAGNELSLQRPVEFVATVGEEGLGNLRGARAYFRNREQEGLPVPHAVLVLDGPGDTNIVHHALGSRRYRITFTGAGGHSWADFGAPNAVHAAARATASLADIPRNVGGRVAVTVSGIGGGESVNSIPANAWMDVDVRGTDETFLARADRELRQAVRVAAEQECANARSAFSRSLQSRQMPRLDAQITLVGERPSGSLSAEHALVRLAQDASRHFGIEHVSAIASTDANIPLSLGIPAITLGAGGTGGAAHTLQEWYDNTNGPRGIARAFAILAALSCV